MFFIAPAKNSRSARFVRERVRPIPPQREVGEERSIYFLRPSRIELESQASEACVLSVGLWAQKIDYGRMRRASV